MKEKANIHASLGGDDGPSGVPADHTLGLAIQNHLWENCRYLSLRPGCWSASNHSRLRHNCLFIAQDHGREGCVTCLPPDVTS